MQEGISRMDISTDANEVDLWIFTMYNCRIWHKELKMETRVVVSETKAKELEKKANDWSDLVYGLEITDAVSCEVANGYLKDCNKLEKEIVAFFADSKKSAHDLHKKIISMESAQLAPVTNMKKHLKSIMTVFIAGEEAYNDAKHLFNNANALAVELDKEIMPGYKYLEEFMSTWDNIKEGLLVGRSEADPYELKKEAQFMYDRIKWMKMNLEIEEQVEVADVEVKKTDTNLRKLSLVHEIEGISIQKLVEAVASGRVPLDWIVPNESAIKRDAKQFETVEAFNNKYDSSGVVLKISRSLR